MRYLRAHSPDCLQQDLNPQPADHIPRALTTAPTGRVLAMNTNH